LKAIFLQWKKPGENDPMEAGKGEGYKEAAYSELGESERGISQEVGRTLTGKDNKVNMRGGGWSKSRLRDSQSRMGLGGKGKRRGQGVVRARKGGQEGSLLGLAGMWGKPGIRFEDLKRNHDEEGGEAQEAKNRGKHEK